MRSARNWTTAAELVVKVHKREKARSVANAEETGVVTAPAPDSPVAKERHGQRLESACGWSASSRPSAVVPLPGEDIQRQGVALSRRTMCDIACWRGRAAESCWPIASRLRCWRANWFSIMTTRRGHADRRGLAHTNGIKEARLWVAQVPGRDVPGPLSVFDQPGRPDIEDFFREYAAGHER